MATRINNDVTLKHADADAVAKMLLDHVTHLRNHARATKSAAIRTSCYQWADDAQAQASQIISKLYDWR